MTKLTQVSRKKCFDGWQDRYHHHSKTLSCDMHFSIYLPPQAETKQCPVLYFLSGLTCNDENFVTKAGAQRVAAELGLILVMPDTSPRGDTVPDAEDGAYDLGLGAGFYVNATEQPWAEHYQMYTYIVDELPELINSNFPTDGCSSISGHSMGGHGALVIALSNLQRFSSVSAFSPIVNPMNCPWGEKAFTAYLGTDTSAWQEYDSSHLLRRQGALVKIPVLIDQGNDDEFLTSQALTRPFEKAADDIGFQATIRYHDGYDHSYFFIASFVESHLRFHASHLGLV